MQYKHNIFCNKSLLHYSCIRLVNTCWRYFLLNMLSHGMLSHDTFDYFVAWKAAGWSKEGDSWGTERVSLIPVCLVRVQQMGPSSGERSKRGPESRDQKAKEMLARFWSQVTDNLYVNKKRHCRSEPRNHYSRFFFSDEWHEVDGFEEHWSAAGNALEVSILAFIVK